VTSKHPDPSRQPDQSTTATMAPARQDVPQPEIAVDDVPRDEVTRSEPPHDLLGGRQDRGRFTANRAELRWAEEVARVVVN
jgi:hypothetical protein